MITGTTSLSSDQAFQSGSRRVAAKMSKQKRLKIYHFLRANEEEENLCPFILKPIIRILSNLHVLVL